MPAIDDFTNYVGGTNAPARNADAVTPSDAADLPHATRALYIGGGGNAAVVMVGGETVTFIGLTAGTILPIRVSRVLATGTTATNMIGLR